MDIEQLCERIKRSPGKSGSFAEPAKRITCADGVGLSVQAGEYAHCFPRENDTEWCQVEVGFPSEKIAELMPYVEDADNPTETVYGYVPISIVVDVINAHGGEEVKVQP